MGGDGSGRPGRRPVAERSLAFPIAIVSKALRAVAAVGPGARSAPIRLSWSSRREEIATASYTVLVDTVGDLTVWLEYPYGGQLMRDAIAIVVTRPHFGGRRFWWRCSWCDRRIGVLYRPHSSRWYCRTCYHITYQSSNDSHQFDAADRRFGLPVGWWKSR